MELQLTCPSCHFAITKENFFCSNCGKKLKEPPASTTIGKQISIYLISVLLPPFGLVPGIRYLFQKDDKAKIIGVVAIALSIISIAVSVWAVNSILNQVNDTINTQLAPYQNLGY